MRVTQTEVEVRYAETDQMGVVHHANYLVWFELGRTQFIKALGFDYARMEEDGVLAPVTDFEISYKKPFRYGEKARIETWLDEYSGLRAIYGYVIYNERDERCVTGRSTHVLVYKETFKPLIMKKVLPNWHEAYMNALKND